MTKEEFAKVVFQQTENVKRQIPCAVYDPHGDCIEFIAKDEAFRGERIDSLVTVYYGLESGEIVGSLIKGVKKLLSKKPQCKIIVRDGKVKIEHLLLARLSDLEGEIENLEYKKLFEVAEETEAEAELLCTG